MTNLDEDLFDNDLHVAVRLGDPDSTEEALKAGYHPDTVGLYEWNALHEAAYNGDAEILEILLKHGADPNKQDLLNDNTALHYAVVESHCDCVEKLLKAGADGSIMNRKKESPVDLVIDSFTKEILLKHGYVSKKEKAVKSILKSSKTSKSSSTSSNKLLKPGTSSSPARTKSSKVIIEAQTDKKTLTAQNETLLTSLKFSPEKKSWEINNDRFLQTLASPVRSLGSSYGSLTSLGSSGCSATDDCAGQFILSFQYNSKKEEFKICMWEVCLITLLPPSKMPKDCSIHFYLKSVLIPDTQYQPEPALTKKSEIFRLSSVTNNSSSGSNVSFSSWAEKEAKFEFKPPVSLEYTNINKELIQQSSVKICLCIQRKHRSFLPNKLKSLTNDPVLAVVEMKMDEAAKKIMKETYDAERHDVIGLTRQSIPLDGVISESSYENQSFSSDPTVPINMTSLPTASDQLIRSSSVGDLKSLKTIQSRLIKKQPDQSKRSMKVINQSLISHSIDLTSEEGRDSGIDKSGTYSISSLDSVISHTSIPNPEVTIRVPPKQSLSALTSVHVDGNESLSDKVGKDVKVQIPQSSCKIEDASSKRIADERNRSRLTHKARNILKSGGKSLITTAQSIVRPNIIKDTQMDDEERSVGNPSKKVYVPLHSILDNDHASSSSVVEINESPTWQSHRRHKPFLSSPQLPRHSSSPIQCRTNTKTDQLVLDIEPRDIQIEMNNLIQSDRYTKDRLYANRLATEKSHRLKSPNSVLRKLVYDETNMNEEVLETDNPGFINT